MRFPDISPLYFSREYPLGSTMDFLSREHSLSSRMNFQWLQGCLLEVLRRSIGNGLLTERGLARWAGISQPHMHHLLKGERALSPGMADRILRALQLTVVDLVELAETESRPGGAHERLQDLVDRSWARREEALRPLAPGPSALQLSAGGPWPLADKSREPGAQPPPN